MTLGPARLELVKRAEVMALFPAPATPRFRGKNHKPKMILREPDQDTPWSRVVKRTTQGSKLQETLQLKVSGANVHNFCYANNFRQPQTCQHPPPSSERRKTSRSRKRSTMPPNQQSNPTFSSLLLNQPQPTLQTHPLTNNNNNNKTPT